MMYDIARDIISVINPKWDINDFDAVNKIEDHFDILDLDIPKIFLDGDLSTLFYELACAELPYKIAKELTDPTCIEWDRCARRVVRTKKCFGSCYVDEFIKDLNKIIGNGQTSDTSK